MHVYSSYAIIYQGLEARDSEQSKDAIELLKLFSFFSFENIRVDFLISAATYPLLEQRQRENASKEETEPKESLTNILFTPKLWKQHLAQLRMIIRAVILADRSPAILPHILRDLEASASFDEVEDTVICDELRLKEALKELNRLSMISYNEASESYSMHPLFHRWVRDRPQMKTPDQGIWAQAATTTLAQCILLPPLSSSEKDERLRSDLLPHVIHVQKCTEEINSAILRNQNSRKRLFPVLKPVMYQRQAVQFAKFSFVYSQGGMWKEAEALQLPVRDYFVDLLGSTHPISVRITLALSATYAHQSRINEAAAIQDKLYQECVRDLGPHHPRTLKVLDELGTSRFSQGRIKDALELHTRAASALEKHIGENHEDTLIVIDNCGKSLSQLFRYEEAMKMHAIAAGKMAVHLGAAHLRTLIAMENLACTYLSLGERWAEAHDLMAQVFGHREEKLGKENPYTLLAICNWARVKAALGMVHEAEEMMVKAIHVAERNLGPLHLGTLYGKRFFGQVLVRQKRYDEAEQVFLKNIEPSNFRGAAGPDEEYPDRLQGIWFLVLCLQEQGKIKEAQSGCNQLGDKLQVIGGQGLGMSHAFAKQVAENRMEVDEIERRRESALEDSQTTVDPISMKGGKEKEKEAESETVQESGPEKVAAQPKRNVKIKDWDTWSDPSTKSDEGSSDNAETEGEKEVRLVDMPHSHGIGKMTIFKVRE